MFKNYLSSVPNLENQILADTLSNSGQSFQFHYIVFGKPKNRGDTFCPKFSCLGYRGVIQELNFNKTVSFIITEISFFFRILILNLGPLVFWWSKAQA